MTKAMGYLKSRRGFTLLELIIKNKGDGSI